MKLDSLLGLLVAILIYAGAAGLGVLLFGQTSAALAFSGVVGTGGLLAAVHLSRKE